MATGDNQRGTKKIAKMSVTLFHAQIISGFRLPVAIYLQCMLFFKTFQVCNTYLANFISLLRNKENRSNEIISTKIALGKYLTCAKFGSCYFFPEPKVALGKDPW